MAQLLALHEVFKGFRVASQAGLYRLDSDSGRSLINVSDQIWAQITEFKINNYPFLV